VKDGVHSFQHVCSASKGAFPTEVLAVLQELGIVKGSGVPVPLHGIRTSISNPRWWPEPSPADYEWRFTGESANSIASLALEEGSSILCLGSPTVFQALLARGADVYLVDRNPYLSELFSYHSQRIISLDVREIEQASSALGRTFDVVVMDPPWYTSHTLYWLSCAALLAKASGSILFPLFPEFVRPSAGVEREEIFAMLEALGTPTSGPALLYETPIFEMETLARAGLQIAGDWRTTDLISVKLSPDRPKIAVQAPDEPKWVHFRFGVQIVSLRMDESENGDSITFAPPYPDGSYLLRSVSARDPIRSRIHLWTSRNRVATLRGISRIRQFLTMLQEGGRPSTAILETARNPDERHSLDRLVALIGD